MIREIKNCYGCRYLDLYESGPEETGSSGFFCNGRDYFKKGDDRINEKKHLKQLESEEYRKKPKRCWEPKIEVTE